MIQENIHEELFKKNGTTVRFLRHPMNQRNQAMVRKRYVQHILEHGVMRDVRSTTVVVPDSWGVEDRTLHVVCGATLLEAAYEAHQLHSKNPQVAPCN